MSARTLLRRKQGRLRLCLGDLLSRSVLRELEYVDIAISTLNGGMNINFVFVNVSPRDMRISEDMTV